MLSDGTAPPAGSGLTGGASLSALLLGGGVQQQQQQQQVGNAGLTLDSVLNNEGLGSSSSSNNNNNNDFNSCSGSGTGKLGNGNTLGIFNMANNGVLSAPSLTALLSGPVGTSNANPFALLQGAVAQIPSVKDEQSSSGPLTSSGTSSGTSTCAHSEAGSHEGDAEDEGNQSPSVTSPSVTVGAGGASAAKSKGRSGGTPSRNAKAGRSDARLARNRTTARLRRERKKQEAKVLTKYVKALRVRVTELESALDALDGEARTMADKVIRSFGQAPRACPFCSLVFEGPAKLDNHLKVNHVDEVNAREQFLVDSKKFGLNANGSPFDDGSDDGRGGAVNDGDASVGSGGQNPSSNKLVRLSSEERKKRRLMRNAASARLCRQRKKLYIENLRAQVPELRHRVKAIEAALLPEVVSRIQLASPLPASIADCDPNDFAAKVPMDIPDGTLKTSPVTGTSAVAALPGLSAASGSSTRKRRSSEALLGAAGRDSAADPAEGLVRATHVGLQHKKLKTTSSDSPRAGISSDIPPLSGWGKGVTLSTLRRESSASSAASLPVVASTTPAAAASPASSSSATTTFTDSASNPAMMQSPLATIPGFDSSSLLPSGLCNISPLVTSILPPTVLLQKLANHNFDLSRSGEVSAPSSSSPTTTASLMDSLKALGGNAGVNPSKKPPAAAIPANLSSDLALGSDPDVFSAAIGLQQMIQGHF